MVPNVNNMWLSFIEIVGSYACHQFLKYLTLFNSWERLLLGTLILNKTTKVKYHKHEQKSDLIQHQLGNELLHASGPVQSNLPPITYISV